MKVQKSLYEFIDLVGNVGEVLLVLKVLKTGDLERQILKSCVYCRSGISARIPDADVLIDFSMYLGLIEIITRDRKQLISISKLGKDLLKFKHPEMDRLTQQQGKLLFSGFLKNFAMTNDISIVINLFAEDSTGNLWISCLDKRIGTYEERILRFLQQLRIAKFREGNVIIDKRDKVWIVDTVLIKRKMNQESLLELLEEKRKRGWIAEEFALKEEKERLVNCGRQDLAKLVRRISEQHVTAGYDILSFDGPESGFFPDRFIEVKGNSTEQISFYISRNELTFAQNMQNQYWIYCVLNIKSNKPKRLVKIENPYRVIFQDKKFKAECVLWRVDL